MRPGRDYIETKVRFNLDCGETKTAYLCGIMHTVIENRIRRKKNCWDNFFAMNVVLHDKCFFYIIDHFWERNLSWTNCML